MAQPPISRPQSRLATALGAHKPPAPLNGDLLKLLLRNAADPANHGVEPVYVPGALHPFPWFGQSGVAQRPPRPSFGFDAQRYWKPGARQKLA